MQSLNWIYCKEVVDIMNNIYSSKEVIDDWECYLADSMDQFIRQGEKDISHVEPLEWIKINRVVFELNELYLHLKLPSYPLIEDWECRIEDYLAIFGKN